MDDHALISVADAARRLDRSTEQVRRYLREGRLNGRRIGGQWFIERAVLDAFFSSMREQQSFVHKLQPASEIEPLDAVIGIVALTDHADDAHEAAVAAYRELVSGGYRLFTTNYVVAETIELLSAGPGPHIAQQWLRDHRLPIYHADEQDEHRARALVISARSEHGLSYTDAISMVVMERFGIADAFAVDPNFLNESA